MLARARVGKTLASACALAVVVGGVAANAQTVSATPLPSSDSRQNSDAGQNRKPFSPFDWSLPTTKRIDVAKIACPTCWTVPNPVGFLRGRAYEVVQVQRQNYLARDRELIASVIAAADVRAAANPDLPIVVVVIALRAMASIQRGRDPQDWIDWEILRLRNAGIANAVIAANTQVYPSALLGATRGFPGDTFSVIGVGSDGLVKSSVTGLKQTLAALGR
jgi:hypothetical protein